MTLIELQAEFTRAIKRVHSHARIAHGGQCTCGDKVLYGHHTSVHLPHPGGDADKMAAKLKPVIENFYAPVVKVIVENPCIYGGDEENRQWRPIIFVHSLT